jgi:hypothetical protein
MTEHDLDPLSDHFDDDDVFDHEDAIEAYCVHCRETVEMENPSPVWTSKGRPGTRGECPICGGTVYRMGRTPAHDFMKRPDAVNVVDSKGIGRRSRAARIKVEAATYIVAAATDAAFAEKLARDLNAVGISTWTDNGETTDNVSWAGGVHPALDQCKKMVVVLSQFGVKTHSVEEAWQYFRSQRKPVVVVLVEAVEPPDDLRTRPRFDFYTDYKRGLRQLVEALSG